MKCLTDEELEVLYKKNRAPIELKLALALAALRTIANVSLTGSPIQRRATKTIFEITGVKHGTDYE